MIERSRQLDLLIQSNLELQKKSSKNIADLEEFMREQRRKNGLVIGGAFAIGVVAGVLVKILYVER